MAKAWFRNVNDGTIEGVEYLNKNIKTVQVPPRSKCWTRDTEYLFDEFIKMMEGK